MFIYLYWRLGETPWDALWFALPLLLIASFPFKRIHLLQRKLIYLSLGVVTYLTLSTLLRDAYLLITGDLFSRYWVILSTFFFVILGTVHALLGPHVKRVTLKIKDLHPSLEGITVAQISDLHIGPSIRLPYVRKVVQRTNKLNPDVIAMTGDIGDGPVRIYERDAFGLGELRAKYGVVYVSGNHEHYWGVDDWMSVMNKLGFTVLKNTTESIQIGEATLSLCGVPDPVSGISPALGELSQEVKKSDLKILLSHRPGTARKAEELGFHIQLSGHTHGGQFFPWTVVVRFVHEFNRGLSRVGNLWIYVNVGTGVWGPLLRIGSTSEISLLTLRKM